MAAKIITSSCMQSIWPVPIHCRYDDRAAWVLGVGLEVGGERMTYLRDSDTAVLPAKYCGFRCLNLVAVSEFSG
jgi:hypothetical protein